MIEIKITVRSGGQGAGMTTFVHWLACTLRRAGHKVDLYDGGECEPDQIIADRFSPVGVRQFTITTSNET